MMQATISVVRAVSAEFIRRALKPLALVGTAAAVGLLAAGAWLTTVSAWWWLLEVLFIAASLLFVAFALLARILLRRIEAPLTKPQKRQVVRFVDKLERSIETVGTPYPVMLFYVVRDTIRPGPDAFVQTVARDSRTLGPDFAALRDEFSKD